MEQVIIKVGGMSCQGCVKGVTAALQGVTGVQAAAVDRAMGEEETFGRRGRVFARRARRG